MYLPSYYEFCSRAKTVAGHNALDTIPAHLEALGAKRPLIVTDKGVTGAGLINHVTNALAGRVEIGAIVDDVPPDSDLSVVNRTAAIYNEKGCDAIIAVGGGSVLDTSKGINIVVSEKSDDLLKFVGAGALTRPLRPLIAVPTTSGTGSEVTLVAVIADKSRNLKMLFTSYFLLPDVAILDSRMTLTLPPFLTAATGMDAMTHAIEAYFCNGKNPLSDATAFTAIELISKNIVNVVKNPADSEGRLALAIGSNLAGMAFSNSMVGMIHTIGHSIGAVCHVPHGICMSILLPYGMEYNLHRSARHIGELLLPLAGRERYAAVAPKHRAMEAVTYVRGMNSELCGLTDGRHAVRLKDLRDRDGTQAIPKDRFQDIARTSLGDGSINYNPEELDFDDVMFVLEHAYEGTPLPLNKINKG